MRNTQERGKAVRVFRERENQWGKKITWEKRERVEVQRVGGRDKDERGEEREKATRHKEREAAEWARSWGFNPGIQTANQLFSII